MSARRRFPVSRSRAQLLAGRAAVFRSSPSISEARLWQSLSGSQLGVGFRRQVVIGRYVADFVAPSVRLIVEVDGGYHARGWALTPAGTGTCSGWATGSCG